MKAFLKLHINKIFYTNKLTRFFLIYKTGMIMSDDIVMVG